MEDRVRRLEKDNEIHRSDITDLKTRLAVAENNIQDIKTELTGIRANTQWIIRLIIGAIIMAIIGFILQGGLN